MASRLSTKCTKRTNHPLNECLGLEDLSPCTESHRIKAGMLPLATCRATRTTPKWTAEVHHLSLLSSLYRVDSLEMMFRPSLSEPDCWPPTDIFLIEEVWIEDTSAIKPRAPNSPMLLPKKKGQAGRTPHHTALPHSHERGLAAYGFHFRARACLVFSSLKRSPGGIIFPMKTARQQR